MHTFSESGAGVPAFLAKLWRLVEDPETNDLISWSTDGRSFIIQNQAQFAKELLPLNYKHNNMASFIRQLNMYGFHKITSIDNGGLRFDKDEMEFTHPCFQKDHPYLLDHIKRKIANSKQQQQQQDEKNGTKMETVNRVLSEMKNMRGRQDSLDTRFATMKQENEALWREIAILRQKHLKQQQIVNKLIQFLVTIVQPSRSGLSTMGNGNNKRRFQLMINDAPPPKVKKTGNEGATIQELGEVLEEVAYENEQELLTSEIPEVTSPISNATQSPYRPGSVNEIVEEVIGPSTAYNRQLRSTIVKQEKPECTSNTMHLIQEADDETGNGLLDAVEYDEEGYQVDHVDESKGSSMKTYNDSDMLNTPMVMEEIQKQEQLKQIRQKPLIKGESLLKAKRNGVDNNDLMSKATQKVPFIVGNTSEETTAVSRKDTNDAGPSGLNNFISDGGPSTSTSFEVNDFIVNEVPSQIFEDTSNPLEKESPMLGGINFEKGFYNPNINITEMKGRQQQTQATSAQEQDLRSDAAEGEINSSNDGRILARFVSSDLDVNRLSTINDYGHHIDTVQTDLDSLKDLLKGEGYQLDANTLLGLFAGNEDVIGYDFPMNLPDVSNVEAQKKSNIGNSTAVTASLHAPIGTTGSSNQLTTYKAASGSTPAAITADYIDLNELLNLEGGTEEESSVLI